MSDDDDHRLSAIPDFREYSEAKLRGIEERMERGERFDDIFCEIVNRQEMAEARSRIHRNGHHRAVIGTCIRTGREIVFASMLDAARATGHYNPPSAAASIRIAVDDGSEHFGYTWRFAIPRKTGETTT